MSTPEDAGAFPALAQLQARMGAALLAPDADTQCLPEGWFDGALPGAEGLRVHRNTVLGGLGNALRMSYPSIDKLVGEDFFDGMAVDYARAEPPQAPQLGTWGAGFAQFAAAFPGMQSLAFSADLARFDWDIDELARVHPAAPGEPGASDGAALLLGGGVRLRFAASLRLHTGSYPVATLREAILAGDTAALQAISLAPAAQHQAMWRAAEGVRARPLSAPSARLIAAALQGADSATVLAAAADDARSDAELAELLRTEVLEAAFVRIES